MRLWAIRLAELLFGAMVVVGAGQLLGPLLLTPRIIAALEHATGRNVAIDGEVYTDIFPAAKLEIFDLRVANVAGGSDRPMLRLHRLRAELSWLALLQGRVRVTRLELEEPDLLLETGEDRAGNWRFFPPAERDRRAAADARQSAGVVSLPVEDISLLNARLTLRNGATDHALSLVMPDIHLTSSEADGQVRIAAQLQQGDQRGFLSMLTGPLAALGATDEPWPVRIGLGTSGGGLLLDGTLTSALGGISIAADLSGDLANLDGLAGLLPGLPLPALHGAVLRAHIAADVAAGSVRISGIDLVSPELDGAGDLDWLGAGNGRLSGAIRLRKLDMDRFALARPATFGPGPGTQPAGPPPPALPTAGDDALFSATPWPDGLLGGMDLDLGLNGQVLTRRGRNFGPASLHVSRGNSKLVLSPVSVTLPGGVLNGSLLASGTKLRPDIAISLDAQGVQSAPLFRQLGLPELLAAPSDIYLRIEGQGDSLHALMQSADGSFGFSAVGGEVETTVATGPLGPLLPQLGLSARDAAGRGSLRCLALAATMRDGVATIGTLTLDSSALFVSGSGSGSVALGPETLDLRLKPTLRLPPVAGIAIPARMTGPIANPRVGWDGPAPQGRALFSAIIGTATQLIAADACETALSAARFGHTGPPPPAGAVGRLQGAVKNTLLPDINKFLDRLP